MKSAKSHPRASRPKARPIMAAHGRPKEAFDRLTHLASQVLHAPVAMLSLIGRDSQTVHSGIGMPEPWASVREIPLSYSLCRHAVELGEPLVVEDVRKDPLLKDMPAIAEMNCIAYVGIPFRSSRSPGSLCVIDHLPRAWVPEEVAVLRELADVAASYLTELELQEDAERRAEAEATLRRNADHFRAIVENAADVIQVQDAEGLLRYVSPSAERVLGYPPGEMAGRPAIEFVHPDEATAAAAGFDEVVRGVRGEQQLELRLRHKDGSWRHTEVVAKHASDEAGAPVLVVNIHDVTRRKQAEAALRQKTASLELLERITSAANQARNVEEAMQVCIDSVCRYTGWPVGHVFLREPSGVLAPTKIWHLEEPERFAPFRTGSEIIRFAAGEGLPGRVLATGEPGWITDLHADPNFPRARQAREVGIRSGFAFPVLAGAEVAAVLEFFCLHTAEPDAPTLEVMAHVGTQLGRVVERQRAEEALTRSEQRTRSVVEMAYDAFIATDAAGLITEWNAQAENTLGWSRQEAIGRSIAETVIPPEYREAHQRGMERFFSTGEARILNRRIEIEALHRDGHRFPVEMTVTPIPTDGTCVFSAFLHDISERKRAEQALRRSEERFRMVARATNDVIWDWDVATGERTWNEAAPKVLRYSAREIKPTLEWWYERIHPSDRERVVTRLHEVATGTGECWSDEYRFLRGDGSCATVLDRGYVVRDERGAPLRMIGSIMDVTERRRAEEAQRFLARASALLDVSLDPETTLSNLARLTVPSLADCCLIDVVENGGELRRVATSHVDSKKRKLLLEQSGAAAGVNPSWNLVRKVARSGEPILISEYAKPTGRAIGPESPLRDTQKSGFRSLMVVPIIAHGNVLGTITLAITGSGRHYSPVDLMVAEDLARRASLALENARLYESAQRAIQTRDEILGMISHDLRNPVHTIKLTASLLHDATQERRSDNLKFLEVISRSADQMARMIEDLLDVSSIDAGRFSILQSQQAVVGLLNGVSELLDPLAARKSIRISYTAADEVSTAWVDSDQILRVFSNLIGNAIKFTPEGGAISVRAERREGDVLFSISDTGPGIPAAQLPHVFDRYWQARKGDRRGAGLGLAIAKGIVEAHGGRIWAESREGEGSTFYFTVPLSASADDE